jgi:hypothetical protein
MSTWINVARLSLADRLNYVLLPWCILALTFTVDLVILQSMGASGHQVPSGAIASIFLFFLALGVLNVLRSLPFGLALGVSRRSYYTGTALLAAGLGAAYGLALTVLQGIERATDGWGMTLHFFRVANVLDGPWYLTWLTTFVALTLMFVYGTWFGVVYWRWNLAGLVAFIATQVLVLLAGTLVVTSANGWPAVGQFFASLTAPGLTGLLAALAVILFAGGLATMRRATV